MAGVDDLDWDENDATTVTGETFRPPAPERTVRELPSYDEGVPDSTVPGGVPRVTDPGIPRATDPGMSGLPRASDPGGQRPTEPGAPPSSDARGSRRDKISRDKISPFSLGMLGKTVGGRYQLVSVIGEGGMGTVYEAEHIELGKRVAVKVLTAMPRQREEAARRFLREARAVSRVESEHVVQVFDVGNDPEVGLHMVMELLRGDDLERIGAIRGALPPRLACAIALQASTALVAAHAAGIVHRDLKPANVFLARREDGTYKVKLVDFGIAKLVRDAAAQHDRMAVTQGGAAVGTPQYMSPEQAKGLDQVDHRTDVYSLGAVLYEMLVGAPAVPAFGSYEATILHVVTNFAPRVSETRKDVGYAVDKLVADMMRADPAHRLASAAEVRERLLAIFPDLDNLRITLDREAGVADRSAPSVPLASPSTLEGRAAATPVPPPRGRKRRLVARGLAFVATMVLGGVITVVALGPRRSENAARAGGGAPLPDAASAGRARAAETSGPAPVDVTPAAPSAGPIVPSPSAGSIAPSPSPGSIAPSLAPAPSALLRSRHRPRPTDAEPAAPRRADVESAAPRAPATPADETSASPATPDPPAPASTAATPASPGAAAPSASSPPEQDSP